MWQVHAALPAVPILGVGGIATGLDALQFVLAGASAVSVGTAVFGDPSAPVRVLAELATALAERGFARFADAVGYAHRAAGVEPVAPPAPGRPGGRPGRAGDRPGGWAGTTVSRSATGSPRRSRTAGRWSSASTRTCRCCATGGCPTDVAGLERFALTVVDAIGDRVAVVKPQSAFFERFGSPGSRCWSGCWRPSGPPAR